MSDGVKFIRWLSTDQGLATIDFISWLLLASGAFAIVLGKKKTGKVAVFLDSVSERLSPARIPHLAKRLTLGPLGMVGLWLFGIAGVAALAFDVVEIFKAFQLAFHGLPTDGRGLAGFLVRVTQENFGSEGRLNPLAVFVWAVKVSATTLTAPLFCFGAIVGLRLTRSPAAVKQYEAWNEKISAVILKHQLKQQFLMQVLVALIGTVALVAFGIGMVVAWGVLVILFRVAQVLLGGIAIFADRRRLQVAATITGILLKVLGYSTKVFR